MLRRTCTPVGLALALVLSLTVAAWTQGKPPVKVALVAAISLNLEVRRPWARS